MNISLAESYLLGLSILLLIIAILVGRQLLRTRADELKLSKLEKNSSSSKEDAGELYELASVQLRKRLYPQATSTLREALKQLENEPTEAKALIENALGFSLAAQNDFKSAITHYKTAIKAKANYPVAINNLAFAKQRLMETNEAYALYIKVLEIDPTNKTAIKEAKKLERIINEDLKNSPIKKGF